MWWRKSRIVNIVCITRKYRFIEGTRYLGFGHIVLDYELFSSYVVKTIVYQGYFHILVVPNPLRSHRIDYVIIKL